MDLEERIAALEAQVEAMEEKRVALRNQFIALQLMLIKALPVISASSAEQLDAAIRSAVGYAENQLLFSDFHPDDIRSITESIESLREDMGERDGPAETPCH